MAVQQNSNSGATSRGAKGKEPRAQVGSPANQAGKSNNKSGASTRGPTTSTAEAQTGERDETYNLVSVLYHALQGAETYGMYRRDAETAGDVELVEFFSDIREEERDRAERAKELLASRLAGVGGLDDEDEDDGDDEDDED